MLKVVLIFVLIAQTSASFYNELKGAMYSVKSSVGKLASDVSTDVKDTYDCTVNAISNVIYGDEGDTSEYYQKCRDKDKDKNKDNNIAASGTIDPNRRIEIIINPINPVIYVENNIQESSKQADTSFAENTMKDQSNKEMEKKLENAAKVLNDESSHLANMSSTLEREFEYLSRNLDVKLNKIEEDEKEFAMERTLHEIERLKLEEEIHKDNTKDDIREVFDALLNKINNATRETSLKDEIKTIIENIENNSSKAIVEELEKWRKKEIEHLDKMKNAVVDQNHSTTEPPTDHSTTSVSAPNDPITFKDVAAKIVSRVTTIPNDRSIETTTQKTKTTTLKPESPLTTVTSETTTVGTIGSLLTTATSEITTVGPTGSPFSTVTSETTTVRHIGSSLTTVTSEMTTVGLTGSPLSTVRSETTTATPMGSLLTTVTSETTTVRPFRSSLTTVTSETITVAPIGSLHTTVTSKTTSVGPIGSPLTTVTSEATTVGHIGSLHTTVTSENTTVGPTGSPLTTVTSKTTTAGHTDAPPSDYDSLLTRDKKATDDAKKLIDDSNRTKKLMDNILKNLKAASNLFENPDLLG